MNNNPYTIENYDFKKAMQEYITKEIQPILISYGLKKYSAYKYIRETDALAQIIKFNIGKDIVKAFAVYIPLFLDSDNIMDYGIEITGSSGVSLLNGKFYTTVYEKEKFNKSIQLEHYYEQHLPNLKKLTYAIEKGVISEMNRINSFLLFAEQLQREDAKFFDRKYNKAFRNGELYKLVMGIFFCLTNKFEQGVEELQVLMKESANEEITKIIIRLLQGTNNAMILDEKEFFFRYKDLCNERRKKYKLLK